MANDEIKELMEAAEQGDVIAQYNLAVSYQEGEGVEENPELAFKWFLKAAEQGDSDAQYQVATCYRMGEGVAENKNESINWLIKSAEQDNANAYYGLASCYDRGYGSIKADPAKAFELYVKSAELGQPQALNEIANCYQQGKGVERNIEKAVAFLSQAAEAGIAEAQHNLGYCYHKAVVVEQSYAMAAEWYGKAVEQGYQPAYGPLAQIYYYGKGGLSDIPRAVEIFTEAADEFDDAEAMYYLSTIYQMGRGVEKDPEKGMDWMIKSAQNGYPIALTFMGECFLDGLDGMPKDLNQAVQCFQAAAQQGERKAQQYLQQLKG